MRSDHGPSVTPAPVRAAGVSWRMHALVLGLRLLVLVPALVAWRRMTWT